ncbi:MAG: hypothetical protein QOD67_1036 [Caballeronia sp.]|jgi:hypothetical protein|nr:hypothetical protein [Caballeronia sp.]
MSCVTEPCYRVCEDPALCHGTTGLLIMSRPVWRIIVSFSSQSDVATTILLISAVTLVAVLAKRSSFAPLVA